MKKEIPVKVGQLCDVVIEDLSHDGLGIARVDGFLLFVKNALPSERVVARIISAKKKYAHAESLEILQPSPNRIVASCPLFEQCGGCQIQHMNYQAQLDFKQSIVMRNLEKFAKIEQPLVAPVLGMDDPWRYRNKTQVPFGRDTGGNIVAGFYQNRTHEIVDMPACLVQTEVADTIVATVKKFATDHQIEPYNEALQTGVLRHVVTRIGFNSGEIMVVLITKTTKLPMQNLLVQQLVTEFPAITSVVHNVNPANTNVIFGEQTTTIYGADYIKDSLDGLDFLISARSFYQVNPVQTEVLYKMAVDFAEIGPDDIVFDAYCGIGTITLFLARAAKQVYGVEIVPDAIADAKQNAKINHLSNVEFAVGKAEVIMPQWIADGIVPDVIVVDPPRKGCDPTLLAAFIAARPKRIVYVSCDSATLARDIGILTAGGYALEKVQPVDMFPQTGHVECVVLMSRKK